MSEPFLGEIKMFGGNFAPRSHATCDGQLLPISQNTALFSLLGTFYGGDGRTTFGLPDLRGRSPVHWGQGPGLSSVSIGTKGGNEVTTLSDANLPPHSHPVNCKGGAGNANTAPGNRWSSDAGVSSATYSSQAADATMAADCIGSTGAGTPFSHRSPYLAVTFIIALAGLFPSRN